MNTSISNVGHEAQLTLAYLFLISYNSCHVLTVCSLVFMLVSEGYDLPGQFSRQCVLFKRETTNNLGYEVMEVGWSQKCIYLWILHEEMLSLQVLHY